MDFDLTSPRTYLTSLALLRQTLELSGRPEKLLELVIALPFSCGTVRVFMRMSNLYLIGFVGADGVYALSDPSEDFVKMIDGSGLAKQKAKKIGLKGDHGSLGTEGRSFGTQELAFVRRLAQYRDGDQYSELAGPLSLLVCLVAEGARFLEIQNTFAGMGARDGTMRPGLRDDLGLWAGPVKSTEVVYVWDKATRARTLSSRLGMGPSELNRQIAQLRMAVPATPLEWSPFVKWAYGLQDADAKLAGLWQNAAAALALRQSVRGTGAQPKLSPEEASNVLTLCQSDLIVRASLGMLLPKV